MSESETGNTINQQYVLRQTTKDTDYNALYNEAASVIDYLYQIAGKFKVSLPEFDALDTSFDRDELIEYINVGNMWITYIEDHIKNDGYGEIEYDKQMSEQVSEQMSEQISEQMTEQLTEQMNEQYIDHRDDLNSEFESMNPSTSTYRRPSFVPPLPDVSSHLQSPTSTISESKNFDNYSYYNDHDESYPPEDMRNHYYQTSQLSVSDLNEYPHNAHSNNEYSEDNESEYGSYFNCGYFTSDGIYCTPEGDGVIVDNGYYDEQGFYVDGAGVIHIGDELDGGYYTEDGLYHPSVTFHHELLLLREEGMTETRSESVYPPPPPPPPNSYYYDQNLVYNNNSNDARTNNNAGNYVNYETYYEKKGPSNPYLVNYPSVDVPVKGNNVTYPPMTTYPRDDRTTDIAAMGYPSSGNAGMAMLGYVPSLVAPPVLAPEEAWGPPELPSITESKSKSKSKSKSSKSKSSRQVNNKIKNNSNDNCECALCDLKNKNKNINDPKCHQVKRLILALLQRSGISITPVPEQEKEDNSLLGMAKAAIRGSASVSHMKNLQSQAADVLYKSKRMNKIEEIEEDKEYEKDYGDAIQNQFQHKFPSRNTTIENNSNIDSNNNGNKSNYDNTDNNNSSSNNYLKNKSKHSSSNNNNSNNNNNDSNSSNNYNTKNTTTTTIKSTAPSPSVVDNDLKNKSKHSSSNNNNNNINNNDSNSSNNNNTKNTATPPTNKSTAPSPSVVASPSLHITDEKKINHDDVGRKSSRHSRTSHSSSEQSRRSSSARKKVDKHSERKETLEDVNQSSKGSDNNKDQENIKQIEHFEKKVEKIENLGTPKSAPSDSVEALVPENSKSLDVAKPSFPGIDTEYPPTVGDSNLRLSQRRQSNASLRSDNDNIVNSNSDSEDSTYHNDKGDSYRENIDHSVSRFYNEIQKNYSISPHSHDSSADQLLAGTGRRRSWNLRVDASKQGSASRSRSVSNTSTEIDVSNAIASSFIQKHPSESPKSRNRSLQLNIHTEYDGDRSTTLTPTISVATPSLKKENTKIDFETQSRLRSLQQILSNPDVDVMSLIHSKSLGMLSRRQSLAVGPIQEEDKTK